MKNKNCVVFVSSVSFVVADLGAYAAFYVDLGADQLMLLTEEHIRGSL